MPKALKTCPKAIISPNLVTLLGSKYLEHARKRSEMKMDTLISVEKWFDVVPRYSVWKIYQF